MKHSLSTGPLDFFRFLIIIDNVAENALLLVYHCQPTPQEMAKSFQISILFPIHINRNIQQLPITKMFKLNK
jgi:hypothetical protein